MLDSWFKKSRRVLDFLELILCSWSSWCSIRLHHEGSWKRIAGIFSRGSWSIKIEERFFIFVFKKCSWFLKCSRGSIIVPEGLATWKELIRQASVWTTCRGWTHVQLVGQTPIRNWSFRYFGVYPKGIWSARDRLPRRVLVQLGIRSPGDMDPQIQIVFCI